MTGKSLLCRRVWLNPLKSPDNGSFHTAVDFHDTEEGPFVEADLCLRDCVRSITLDFGFHDKGGLKKRMKKAKLLLKEVQDFHDALEAASEAFLEVS